MKFTNLTFKDAKKNLRALLEKELGTERKHRVISNKPDHYVVEHYYGQYLVLWSIRDEGKNKLKIIITIKEIDPNEADEVENAENVFKALKIKNTDVSNATFGKVRMSGDTMVEFDTLTKKIGKFKDFLDV